MILTLATLAWVQRRSLLAFFHADDLVHLQQAAGLSATPWLPWRFLTQVVYFRAMLAAVGPDPFFFMAVNLAVHLMNAVLLLALFRNLAVPRTVALAGITLFGASPLLHTVIGHAVIINDILALCFTTASLLVLRRSGRAAFAASLGLFVLAILSKESVLFLPLLALVPPFRGPGTRPRRAYALLALVAVVAIGFLVARATGNAPAGAAYELGFGSDVVHNFATYVAWTVSLHRPIPDLVRSLDLTAWHIALPVMLLLAVAAIGRSPLAMHVRFGLAWWVLGLLPVLPLVNSAYAHYLYVALPGLALAGAAAVVRLLSWATARRGRALVPAAAGVLMILYVLRADALIQRRTELRVAGIDLPLDAQVRSMEVARRAIVSAGSEPIRSGTKLALLAVRGSERRFGARSGRRRESAGEPAYDLMNVVLAGGQALRVFYPQIDTVEFVSAWSSRLEGYELALRTQEGMLIRLGRGPRAHEAAGHLLIRSDLAAAAAPYFDSLRVLYPADRSLRMLRITTLDASGRRAEAIEEARALTVAAPGDTIALLARTLLARWKER